jgi:hypothetical protein
MATFSNKKASKTSKNEELEFNCEPCDYICSKKYNLDRHVLTAKHLKATNGNISATNLGQNEQTYLCAYCSKQYSNRSGLWRHNKKCFKEPNDTDNTKDIKDKDLIMALIKDNSELKNLIIKVIEKDSINTNNSHNTTNTNTNNSHNKTFNLSVYLNETCKDAIDINDFVKSIQVKEITENQPSIHNSNQTDAMQKITPIINDPMVQIIDCPGPEKIISVTSFGRVKSTNIILSKEEIDQILQEFSNKSRIPLIPGVFRALIENISVTAVISEMLGNRFIIQKRSKLL